MTARDERLHEALSEIGADLPEPTASARVRERIEHLPCAMPEVRMSLWRRAGVGVLGAVAATFAISTGVMYVQNQRLSMELRLAHTETSPLVRPANSTPLVALNFYNEKCPVACEIMPRFDELMRMHADDEVLFVTIDVSESKQAQGIKLAEALDCAFVYTCDKADVKTGTILLVDMRTQEVIKAFRGVEEIDAIEAALDEALIACGRNASDG